MDLEEYLTKLASDAPAPGGGSAAMLVGAAGCSLVAMVARITRGSKKYEGVYDVADRLVREADDLRKRMLTLRERDEIAFEAVVTARGDKEAMQRALADAAAVPLEGALASARALALAADALKLNNPHLISDAGCAAEFVYAAMVSCVYNVRINHKYMHDSPERSAQRKQLDELETQGAALLQHVRSSVTTSLT
ncbi:MAG TPA: cyclodeaminase/cyclohydrolase family protein [Candidatus Baltobacteraceae bacterium]|nr:cyclodeaminase/cyclohydrolase family protein [Candidatus Baltobacteraceae bacterium]